MPQPSTILTVGNFDGVHAGHRAILRRALDLAAELDTPAGVAVLAFDPHPLTRLAPDRAPPPLTPFTERDALLRSAGATIVERLSPTPDFLAQTPEQFVDAVIQRHNPAAFVEGTDFHFGRRRAGNIDTLRTLCEPRGIAVEVVPPVAVGLSDNTAVTCSSSTARWLVQRGRVRDAWAVLARPHRLTGTVVRGERRGRELGYPTANLDTPNLLPADGVYAALATLPDGATTPGALSVGTKPQFHVHDAPIERTAEVFLLDSPTVPDAPNLPGLPEYGWTLALDLVGWVREQLTFDSLDRMLEQFARDCDRVRRTVVTPVERQTPEPPPHVPTNPPPVHGTPA